MMMLICFLAANFAMTMLYIVIKGFHRDELAISVFFIFLPILGFLIYFLVGLLQLFEKKVGADREALLIEAFDIAHDKHPDMQAALNVVPMEDAIAISKTTEKRDLLLKQLKKNLKDNYKILAAAENDEDSELSHYVAAAKMEVYRILQTQWLECRRDYEKEPDNPEKFHITCEVLIEILASGVFSIREQSIYRKRLCGIVQNQIIISDSEVSQSEFEEYLNSLINLGRYEEAELLWQKYSDRMQSEYAYQNMLKMFYQTGERHKFEIIMDNLQRNREIRLSSNGMDQLLYWTDRLEKTTVGN